MAKAITFNRGDVVLVEINPVRGSEIRKTRPCVIVSPDEMNAHISTYLVAPLTTGQYAYPFRLPCRFQGTAGYIVLDQLRTIDHERIVKGLGRIHATTLSSALAVLQEMFAP